MRRACAILAVVCVAPLCAQTVDSPELVRARQEIERLSRLVDAGAMPRAHLAQAEDVLAEAQDDQVLRGTLYGAVSVEDLSEEQILAMLEAAARRVERQKTRVDQQKKLVEEGVAARTSLTPSLEELDSRRKTYDLAIARSNLFRDLFEMVRAEQALDASLEHAPEQAGRIAERYDGDGFFRPEQLKGISEAFQRQFSRALPVSARGETRLHKALGFDHRNRVDVALNPDHPEGVWLRRLLEAARIPYFAFRGFVPGKSTAAHIHIGPPSPRIRVTD